MTQIWYEVFPLTIIDREAVLLQSTTNSGFTPWLLPHQPNIHPNTLIIEQLTSLLGSLSYTRNMIVHSTSWRYEAADDQMLLTYLAILPQKLWLEQQNRAAKLAVRAIGTITNCLGSHLFPPEQIERQHVLAHALDHLASLNTYDPMIQSALETEWQEILHSRQPRPAGGLQRPSVRQKVLVC